MRYCGWLNIRGVPIFVVFVEGPIQDFSLRFSVRSMKENIMATDFEPHEGVILVQSKKLEPMKIEPSTILKTTQVIVSEQK